GNKAIPAPTKSTVPSPDIGDHAQGGTSYSRDAPDAIFPSLYYVRGRQNHPPVSLLRTNNMPIPAGDLYNGPPGWWAGHRRRGWRRSPRARHGLAGSSRPGGLPRPSRGRGVTPDERDHGRARRTPARPVRAVQAQGRAAGMGLGGARHGGGR